MAIGRYPADEGWVNRFAFVSRIPGASDTPEGPRIADVGANRGDLPRERTSPGRCHSPRRGRGYPDEITDPEGAASPVRAQHARARARGGERTRSAAPG